MVISPGMVVSVLFQGTQLAKRRPALVVSTDTYHAARPDVIVALLTTNLAAATAVTDYALQDWSAAGLHRPTAFRAFLFCPPAHEVIAVIGSLSDRDWKEVQARLRLAIAVN